MVPHTGMMRNYINRKILVGSKIEMVNWSLHPICNMLEHHPDPSVASSCAPCIEFSYNNSRPCPYFSKLGWSA